MGDFFFPTGDFLLQKRANISIRERVFHAVPGFYRLRGLKAANGLGMLIYQAVFALEYFADVRIDAKEMEQHVIEACGLGGEA